MSCQRWTAQKNIQFIQIYKQHECLWNPRNVEYKHQRVRDMAYEEIRKAMGMDNVKEVVTRIRILRNTQTNEMHKAKKHEHYVSKIAWLPHLDFINDVRVTDTKIVRVTLGDKSETHELYYSDTVSSEGESLPSAQVNYLQDKFAEPCSQHNDERSMMTTVSVFNETGAVQQHQSPVANEVPRIIQTTTQRWTAEMNIEFLKMYKKYQCLWNPKNEHYKNPRAREYAYRQIMQAMEMKSVKEVVARIRILRNTYSNEMAKIKNGKHQVSKLSWVPYLDFIKDVRVTDKNMSPSEQEETQDPYDSDASEEANYIDPTVEKRMKLEDPLDPIHSSFVQEKVSLPASKENDEFALFGQTVAEQLRQLPLQVALETEEMILSAIRSQRTKCLASTSSRGVIFQIKQE